MMLDKLSKNQAVSIIVLFIFGSSVIIGVSTDAHQDSWISLILATILATPLLLIYARIIKLFPGNGLYEIAELLFGKIFGKIIIALMSLYGIYLGALVLRNFSEYMAISSLYFTPQIVVMILMILTTVYIARSNITTFGKWGIAIFIVAICTVIFTVIFSLGNMDLNNIMPIMEHDINHLTSGAFKIITFPLAETVLILPLASSFKKECNPYKIYIYGLLIGALILLVIVLRNLVVLGMPMMVRSYFPSYTAARVIELGDFLTRIEGFVTINFVLAGITKITVCLIAATRGIAKIFNINNCKPLVLPTSMLILVLSVIIYQDIFEMYFFINNYQFIVIPFQIIIPILVWIVAEIKVKKNFIHNKVNALGIAFFYLVF